MVKIHTTLSVDDEVLKKAKLSGLNISEFLEKKLKINLLPSKKDLPDNALKMKCTKCMKEIEYGFLCEERNLFLCQECQDNFNMTRCPHQNREHSHIRVPGFEGQFSERIEKVKEITNAK